jgi:hypothetical protein
VNAESEADAAWASGALRATRGKWPLSQVGRVPSSEPVAVNLPFSKEKRKEKNLFRV